MTQPSRSAARCGEAGILSRQPSFRIAARRSAGQRRTTSEIGLLLGSGLHRLPVTGFEKAGEAGGENGLADAGIGAGHDDERGSSPEPFHLLGERVEHCLHRLGIRIQRHAKSAAARCPSGTVGGRTPRTSKPPCLQRRRERHGSGIVADDHGQDLRAGRRAIAARGDFPIGEVRRAQASFSRRSGSSARMCERLPDRDRHERRRRGGIDEGPAAVDHEIAEHARPGDERPGAPSALPQVCTATILPRPSNSAASPRPCGP